MNHLGAYHLGPGHIMTDAAMQWPIEFHVEQASDDHLTHAGKMQAHLRCKICGQSVQCLSPDWERGGYMISGQLIVSGILAHLKISHEDALPRT